MKNIKIFEEFINEAVKREDKKLVKDVTAYGKSKGLKTWSNYEMEDQFNDGEGGAAVISIASKDEGPEGPKVAVHIGWQDNNLGYTVLVNGADGYQEEEYDQSIKQALAIVKEYIGRYH